MSHLAIYVRVSTQNQMEDGTSIDTQLELGKLKAKELDFTPIIFNEGGKSSHSDHITDRPKLVELISEIDRGNIKHLWVFNTDRLGRNESVWMTIKLKLLKSNVRLYTQNGVYDFSNPMDKMLLNLMSSISVYDNELRMERFRIGKLHKLKSNFGHWKGGQPPFGYKTDKGKLVIHKEQQKWVEFIYQKYKEGNSIDYIRLELMKNGVLSSRGKPFFSHRAIQLILQHTYYEGYYTFTDSKTDETITIQCPPLLPKSLIEEVRDIYEKRSYKRGQNNKHKLHNNTTYESLLNGFIWCGVCGSKMGPQHKSEEHSQQSYYYCLTKTNYYKNKGNPKFKRCTSKKNINLKYADEVIWKSVVNTLSDSHLFRETIKTNVLETHKPTLTPQNKRKLTNQKKKLEKQLTNISDSISSLTVKSIVDEVDNQTIVSQLKEHRDKIQTQYNEIEDKIAEAANEKKKIDWYLKFKDKIDNLKSTELTIKEKREFMSELVDKITITPIPNQQHSIQIDFNINSVGDKLIWKDKKKKALGYKLIEGEKTLTMTLSKPTKTVVEQKKT